MSSPDNEPGKFTLWGVFERAALTVAVVASMTGFLVDNLTLGPLIGVSTSAWVVALAILSSTACLSLIYALWHSRTKTVRQRSGINYAICLTGIAISALLVGMLVDHQGPARAKINTPSETTPNVVDASGTSSNLIFGEDLYIFVQWDGSTETHLQWGPCAIEENGSGDWKCDGVTVGPKDGAGKKYVLLLTAAKGRARSFTEALHDSAKNPGNLASSKLFEGVIVLDKITVTRR